MSLRRDDRSTPSRLRLSLCAGRAILFACFVFSITAHALPKRETRAVHKQIESLEMEWRQAQVDNDIAVISNLLADDYVGITANGTVETKSQTIALRKAGTIRITSLDLDDLKVRLYGDTAVVTSKAELQGVNGQSDISGNIVTPVSTTVASANGRSSASRQVASTTSMPGPGNTIP